MQPAPDPELVRNAKAGDDAAFETLLRPLIDPAYRFACVMLDDADAAQDVVQEAAVKAWRKINQLHDGYAPQPWFFGIVANECRSLKRTRWWSTTKVSYVPAVVEANDERIARDEDLRRAIQRLDRRDRAVITLHYFLDLSLEDVASITRQSAAAVRSRLYRALHKLRPALEIPEGLR